MKLLLQILVAYIYCLLEGSHGADLRIPSPRVFNQLHENLQGGNRYRQLKSATKVSCVRNFE